MKHPPTSWHKIAITRLILNKSFENNRKIIKTRVCYWIIGKTIFGGHFNHRHTPSPPARVDMNLECCLKDENPTGSMYVNNYIELLQHTRILRGVIISLNCRAVADGDVIS